MNDGDDRRGECDRWAAHPITLCNLDAAVTAYIIDRTKHITWGHNADMVVGTISEKEVTIMIINTVKANIYERRRRQKG
jgi:hypothetical protein